MHFPAVLDNDANRNEGLNWMIIYRLCILTDKEGKCHTCTYEAEANVKFKKCSGPCICHGGGADDEWLLCRLFELMQTGKDDTFDPDPVTDS